MLGLWLWIEHWFIDLPSFWGMLRRVFVTMLVLITVIFAAGLVLDLSSETVGLISTGAVIGISAWSAWAANKIAIRYREQTSGPRPPTKRSRVELRKDLQG